MKKPSIPSCALSASIEEQKGTIQLPRRRLLVGAGSLPLAMALPFAPFRSAISAPVRGGVIRIASHTQSTSDTCDPAKLVMVNDYIRIKAFYNSLMWLDDQGEPVHDLAESHELLNKQG